MSREGKIGIRNVRAGFRSFAFMTSKKSDHYKSETDGNTAPSKANAEKDKAQVEGQPEISFDGPHGPGALLALAFSLGIVAVRSYYVRQLSSQEGHLHVLAEAFEEQRKLVLVGGGRGVLASIPPWGVIVACLPLVAACVFGYKRHALLRKKAKERMMTTGVALALISIVFLGVVMKAPWQGTEEEVAPNTLTTAWTSAGPQAKVALGTCAVLGALRAAGAMGAAAGRCRGSTFARRSKARTDESRAPSSRRPPPTLCSRHRSRRRHHHHHRRR